MAESSSSIIDNKEKFSAIDGVIHTCLCAEQCREIKRSHSPRSRLKPPTRWPCMEPSPSAQNVLNLESISGPRNGNFFGRKTPVPAACGKRIQHYLGRLYVNTFQLKTEAQSREEEGAVHNSVCDGRHCAKSI
jgi:hypothetical protein